MKNSMNNHQIRDALLSKGFKDITSEGRSTKSWRLQHPQIKHWVSVKLAKETTQPMATSPLVIHPEDARKLEINGVASSGITIEQKPYRGSSTIYPADVLGRAISLESELSVNALIEILVSTPNAIAPVKPLDVKPTVSVQSVGDETISTIDPFILAAAAVDIDAGLSGRSVATTTRLALIEARVGQGQFREELMTLWDRRCAVTACGIETALIASHAIPWKDNKQPEVCLDPYNGLLLTASIDRLFDRGLISFDDDGRMLRKPELSDADLTCLGLQPDARLRAVHPRNLPYLAAHRHSFGF